MNFTELLDKYLFIFSRLLFRIILKNKLYLQDKRLLLYILLHKYVHKSTICYRLKNKLKLFFLCSHKDMLTIPLGRCWSETSICLYIQSYFVEFYNLSFCCVEMVCMMRWSLHSYTITIFKAYYFAYSCKLFYFYGKYL